MGRAETELYRVKLLFISCFSVRHASRLPSSAFNFERCSLDRTLGSA